MATFRCPKLRSGQPGGEQPQCDSGATVSVYLAGSVKRESDTIAGSRADAAREMIEKHVVNSEVVIPEGKYFVLGDNRDMSLDGRHWGFVGSDDILGKPLLIYGSEDRPTERLVNEAFARPRRIRWERFFKLL